MTLIGPFPTYLRYLITFYLHANWNASNTSYTHNQVLDTEAEGVDAGQLTVVENDGTVALTNRHCAFTAQGTPVYNDLGLYSGPLTRGGGIAFFGTFYVNATNKEATVRINNTAGLSDSYRLAQMNIDSLDRLVAYFWSPANSNISYTIFDPSYSKTAPYEFCYVLGGYNSSGAAYRSGETISNYTYGMTLFIRGGAWSKWTRVWTDKRDNTASLYLATEWYNHAGWVDNFEVSDKDFSDVLLATDYEATPAASTTFTHTADFLMEFEATTLPDSPDSIDVFFRVQDASNYWICRVYWNGSLHLTEVIATVENMRDNEDTIVSDGDRVVVIADGANIEINTDGTPRINYASATNYQTETDGEVDALGANGVISNLATLPRDADIYQVRLVYSDLIYNERQTVLEGGAAHEDDNAYEPTVIFEGDAQILSGDVYKMWYVGGWSTESGVSVNYAESTDGLSWTKYGSNPVLDNYARAFVIKQDSTYYLFAVPFTGGAINEQIDLYTSSDGIAWSLDTAAILSIGAGGQWDDNTIDNCHVWVEGSTWYMLYEASPDSSNWDIGLATASDPAGPWTKDGNNPVINEAGMRGGPFVIKVGSTYYLWLHGSISGVLPTDIYRYSSTDLINWTAHDDQPHMLRQMDDEGPDTAGGQLADPFLLEKSGQVLFYYEGGTNGAASSGELHIKRAVFDGPLVDLIST